MMTDLFKSYLVSTVTLFFVIDAIGNLPAYVALTEKFTPKKRRLLSIRELFFALLTMFGFYLLGKEGLSFLGIDKTTIHISGGLVLFLIGIRLIFFDEEKDFEAWKKTDPFWVPLATPLIAGPSVLALIMIYAQENLSSQILLSSIVTSWALSALILFFAYPIYHKLKAKGVFAMQRLMGLILVLVSVEKMLEGIQKLLTS